MVRLVLVVVLVCALVGFVLPGSYWTFVYLSRLLVYGGIGFLLGYLVGRMSK